MRIILLVFFIISSVALADDYQIFESLDSELEVDKRFTYKFHEIKNNDENFCNGDTYEIKDLREVNSWYGCGGKSKDYIKVYKKLIGEVGKKEFLVHANQNEVSFDDFEPTFNQGDDYLVINIKNTIKVFYEKYEAPIQSFYMAEPRFYEVTISDEFSNAFNFSSKARTCRSYKEKYDDRRIYCGIRTRYFFKRDGITHKGKIQIPAEVSNTVTINYEVEIQDKKFNANISSQEGQIILPLDDIFDKPISSDLPITLRCLNCSNLDKKTKKLFVRNYNPEKVLEDGGGFDESSYWKAREERYRTYQEKEKERTEENLREAPIKGLNEELKKKKIDDAKKQCKDIGYKPNTDKFRDCILELM